MSSIPAILSSRRLNRALPWIAGVVLAAGVVAFLLTYFRNTATSNEAPLSNEPAQIVPQPKRVAIDERARRVAGKFILTAVARKNLAASWEITHPSMRKGYTKAEWIKGDIPVVPYPSKAIDKGIFKVDYAYPNEILLQVALLPKEGARIKPQIFLIGLKAQGKGKKKRWLVDYWAPRASIPIHATRD